MASPNPARVAPPSPSPAKLRLHDTAGSAAVAARNSIIHSSAKGWSPLQINKREREAFSPAKPSSLGASTSGAPRRTSNSFRHMATNSLVANSPFKDLSTTQGAMSNGVSVPPPPAPIHERRAPSRQLGQAPQTATGSANTPKAAIGLGISTAPISRGAAVSGNRKVSSERKISYQSVVATERKTSAERRAAAAAADNNQENQSPEKAPKQRRTPRQSRAYMGLVENEYVTHSPFKSDSSSSNAESAPAAATQARAVDIASPEGPEEVLASPATRRVSGGSGKRRASPSTSLTQARAPSMSPSASPQRSFSNSGIPSPLSRDVATVQDPAAVPKPKATPTPTKSSLASAKKRLVGPRVIGAAQESPTRKTVTFQATPDVKEFERMSVEGSFNGSFEDDDNDTEWTDVAEQDDAWLTHIVQDEHNVSRESQTSEEDHVGDESATADFMDSLIEEGLFSPPELDTPVFADTDNFELPMEASLGPDDITSSSDMGAALSTPSIGNETPLMGHAELVVPSSPHHIHIITPHVKPVEQPKLPHSDDHDMLFNGNVLEPSSRHIPQIITPGPHAHQVGPLQDPFITIQTATDLYVGHEDRAEGGIPLGRSSHHDRVTAARMVASQGLGRGFPSAPARQTQGHELLTARELADDSWMDDSSTREEVTRDEIARGEIPHQEIPQREVSGGSTEGSTTSEVDSVPELPSGPVESDVFGAVIASPAARKVSDRVVSDVPELQGPSRRMMNFKKTKPSSANSTPKRGLPRPPAPAPLELPSPVQYPSGNESEAESTASHATSSTAVSADEAEVVTAKRGELSLPFSLPAIGTSPLLTDDSVFADQRQDEPHVPDDAPLLKFSQLKLDDSQPKAATHTRRVSDYAPKLDLDLGLETKEEPAADLAPADEEEAEDAPLTPPPKINREVRESSPRIPSFEFGDISIDMGDKSDEKAKNAADSDSSSGPDTPRAAATPTKPTVLRSTPKHTTPRSSKGTPNRFSNPATPTRATPSQPSVSSPLAPGASTARPFSELEPTKSPIKDEADGNVNPRVRQRISRELIRETVNKRAAAEGRPLSVVDMEAKNKALPPAPIAISSEARQSFSPTSPRSPTSAAAAYRQSQDSPKSALDKLMSAIGKDTKGPMIGRRGSDSPSKLVNPVGILQKAPKSDAPEIPGSVAGSIVNDPKALAAARRSRRRSASTSEIDTQPEMPLLTLGIDEDSASILESVRDEFDNIGTDRGYRVREQRRQIRATYTGGPATKAGDLETGRAWRPVRRPSDMNTHAKELRAARAREANEGKSSGTVFVKVLGIEALNLPLPREETHFCITLDNGIDYIRTPYQVLGDGVRINQEFSLVEHSNFEFSLSLDIRRSDAHIVRLVNERNNPPKPTPAPRPLSRQLLEPPRPQTPVSSVASRTGGFRALFQSPRKPKHQRSQSSISAMPPPPAPLPSKEPAQSSSRPQPETIARYLVDANSSTVAKTHIAFKPIARQCEAKVLEIRYPMFAMFKGTAKSDGTAPRPQVAKITLQFLRLPPLPGLEPEELPGSIDETLRGLRHHAWHEQLYHEGILTQVGGDCRVPRRRLFRLVGANLVAINEVTRKEVASIDLAEAVEMTDLNLSAATPQKDLDDYDPFGVRPRSFQLKFKDGEKLTFSADKDDDKAVW